MMQFLFSIRCRVLPRIALAACAGLCLTLCATAKEAKVFSVATLVEAANYLPCRDGCSALTDTASAFCFRQGDQVLVGEGRSYLHEGKFSAVEEQAGKQLQLRFNRRFLWVRLPDGPVMKLQRGSQFENFKDGGCVSAVHGPILAAAYAQSGRPRFPSTPFRWPVPAKTIPFCGTGARWIPIKQRSVANGGIKTATRTVKIGTARKRWLASRWERSRLSIRFSAGMGGWF
jgi:hypothetical protein